jgi:hypothetical protein
MSRNISRRQFHTLIGAAVAMTRLPGSVRAVAATAPKKTHKYLIRQRFEQAGVQIWFWVRVIKRASVDEPVEFTQQLSTTRRFSTIFAQNSYRATAGNSHIQRWTTFLDPTTAPKNVNVYCRIVDTQGTVISKIWKIKKAVSASASQNA